MIRRDFLKFMGILGAAVTIPAGLSLPATAGPRSETFIFDFDGYKVIIEADEGDLAYIDRGFEIDNFRDLSERHKDIYRWFDFSIYLRAKSISGGDFINKIQRSRNFNITFDNCTLRGCIWNVLEYNFSQGHFFIGGTAPSQ